MKSRISVEVDFDNNNRPVIQVHERRSDDVRDKLIDSVFQQLGHHSRWFRAEFKHNTMTDGEAGNLWHLIPVTPEEYDNEIKLMVAHRDERFPKKQPESFEFAIRDNSTGLENFLRKEGVKFRRSDFHTFIEVSLPEELFTLGQKLAAYKVANPNG